MSNNTDVPCTKFTFVKLYSADFVPLFTCCHLWSFKKSVAQQNYNCISTTNLCFDNDVDEFFLGGFWPTNLLVFWWRNTQYSFEEWGSHGQTIHIIKGNIFAGEWSEHILDVWHFLIKLSVAAFFQCAC